MQESVQELTSTFTIQVMSMPIILQDCTYTKLYITCTVHVYTGGQNIKIMKIYSIQIMSLTLSDDVVINPNTKHTFPRKAAIDAEIGKRCVVGCSGC